MRPLPAALIALLVTLPSRGDELPQTADAATRTGCVVLPLSGPHAALGTRLLSAIEAAWAEANLPPLRRYDTSGTPEGAVAAVGRAAAEGCAGAVGGVGDRESVAAADAAEAANLPFLCLGLVPDGRRRAGVAFVRTPRAEPIQALARRLAADGVGHAVLLHPPTHFGRAAVGAFRAAFEAAGGRVLAERAVVQSDAKGLGDLAAALAADLARAPERPACGREAVFMAVDLDLARRLVPFLDYHGVTGPRSDAACPAPAIAGPAVWNDPARVRRSGDALDGAIFADVAVTGDGPVDEAEAADAASLLATAVRASGALGREGVARALMGEMAFTGRTGDATLSGGRVTGRRIEFYEIRRGAIVPLAPQQAGEAPALPAVPRPSPGSARGGG